MKKKMPNKAKGGLATAAKLTATQRIEKAKKAAAGRWGVKPPKAIRKGNFKDEFGFDVECYVLDDENRTAVIHQRGMGEALGLSRGPGNRFPRFVKGKIISDYLGPDLAEKLNNPVKFQRFDKDPKISGKGRKVHGFEVTLLIDVCKAIIAAENDGKLVSSQLHIAKQAHVIVNASAKAGIKGLVYALTGYDATRAEVINAFKMFVRQEARGYEKEFPDELYEHWYRLYGLQKPERNHPWKFAHLTRNHVYFTLAKSNGKILESVISKKELNGKRNDRLHQFLADIGVKVLRRHLGRLLGIAELSETKEEYERNIKKVFGDQLEIDFKE